MLRATLERLDLSSSYDDGTGFAMP